MTERQHGEALAENPRVYRAFGLKVHSDFILPLEARLDLAGDADVLIRRGLPHDESAAGDCPVPAAPECPLPVCPARLDLDLGDWGQYAVIAGRRIHALPGPAADARTLSFFLLERLLVQALYQRGWWVFHGSVIALEQGAVAILAPPGGGKTTVALALQAGGGAIVDDDILAIEPCPCGPLLVCPGLPLVKLWPDQARRWAIPSDSLARQRPGSEKLVAPLLVPSPDRSLPLRKIYVLGPGAALALDPLAPAALTRFLITHWYGRLYPGERFAGDRDALPLALHQAAAVARRTPGARLFVPRDDQVGLAGLGAILRADLARLSL